MLAGHRCNLPRSRIAPFGGDSHAHVTHVRPRIAARSSSRDTHAAECSTHDNNRRQVLRLTALSFLGLGLSPAAQAKPAAGSWSSPGLDVPEDPSIPKFFKTDSGVKVQELAQGSSDGPVVQMGDTVLFDYVLRRSNGYFIYSTIEGVSFQPRDVPVGPVSFRLGDGSKLIPGLQEVLVGMRKGGKRRALIPAAQGYTRGGDGVDIYCADAEPQPPTFGTKRQLQSHCTEPLLFEVEVLRITPAA